VLRLDMQRLSRIFATLSVGFRRRLVRAKASNALPARCGAVLAAEARGAGPPQPLSVHRRPRTPALAQRLAALRLGEALTGDAAFTTVVALATRGALGTTRASRSFSRLFSCSRRLR